MANFLGAAFGFAARDVGLKSAVQSTTKNLDKMNDLLDDQEKKGSKLGDVWGKMRNKVDSFNLASIAGNMRQITGETGNLSNSMESMAVSYAQSAKPIISSMNLTGKEASKMTSKVVGMAISLNASADEVAETFKAIHNAGGPAKEAIDAMGMSEKDWVKVVSTTQVSMQDYAGILGDMVASWGASDKQAGQMINNIMDIGKQAKIGTSGIKGAKEQLDALDAIFEQLPPSMARSADEVQNLMESTYKLAGAFREMGETEEQATQLGQDTAKMFAQQAVEIERLYAHGGEGALDDSPLFKFLTRLGVGAEGAIDIIKTGSVDAVKGVQRINDAFTKMGGVKSPQVEQALGELSKAMGESAAGLGFLASNADVGTKSLAAMNQMTVKGKDALKEYGKQAHSSGRTLQDAFDLAKESFDTQLRRVARKDVKKLAKTQMDAYRNVGKEIRGLGSDETWGPLVHSMSVFKQMGLKGMLLDMTQSIGGKKAAKGAAEMGVKFDLIVDSAKQLSEELGPAMEILGKFGPLGMAAGGIAAWFSLSEEQRQKIQATFQPMIDWIGKNLKEQFDKMADPETINGIIEKAGSILKGVLDTAIEWKSIGKEIFDSIDWDSVTNKFVAALGTAFEGTVFGTMTGLTEAKYKAQSAETQKQIDATRAERLKINQEEVAFEKRMMAGYQESIKAYERQVDALQDKFFAGEIGEFRFAEEEGALLGKIEDEKDKIKESGSRISELISEGIEIGADGMKAGLSNTFGKAIVPQLPQSPPLDGPLQGDFLPNTGREMIEMIGDGMLSATDDLTMVMSQVLSDSVDASFEAYSDKVKEWSEKKNLLRSVAKQMVQEFGGNLNLGKVEVEGATLDAKQTFEASLDMPGLAGVIAAIASDGHKTRVVLKKILDDTSVIAKSQIIQGGGAAATPVLAS